ncbi:MAG: hypothetical protein R3F20_06860 [Planctomycetota bacterium]
MTSQHYGTRFVRVEPNETQVEVRFEEPAWAWVRILTADGSPSPRLEVAIEDEAAGTRFDVHADFIVGNEARRIGPLAPGRHELILSRSPGAGALVSREIDLGSGENAVEIELPVLGRIVASFPGAEVGGWVNLSRKDEDGIWELGGAIALDAERRANFTRLLPGSYLLRLGERWATVEVSTGETSELTVGPATKASNR